MKTTLRQLEIFVAIANNHNITMAAELLHLSQSAMSMGLTTLEQQLGIKLFDRVGKRLLLNAAGHQLLPKAMHLLAQARELEHSIGKKTGELSGTLTISASSTVGNYVLPSIIGKFAIQHPKVKAVLHIGNTEQVINQVLKYSVDIGMIEGSCQQPEIEVLPWKKDQLVIVVAPKHVLAKKASVTKQDLQAARWILREKGSGTREKFEEALGRVEPFLELGNTEAIKNAVIAGFGVGCLSKAAVAELIQQRKLVELKTPLAKLERDFYILLHKQRYQTQILSAFMETIKV